MALKTYDGTPGADNRLTVARRALVAGAKVNVEITLTDNPANDETIIFNGLTWTFKTSGASGRQVNLDSTAALTAAAFVAAFNLHADGADYVASNPSGAIIKLVPVAASGTITGVTGTADKTMLYTGQINDPVAVPKASAGVMLVIDDAVVLSKVALTSAMENLALIVSEDLGAVSSVDDLPTSGSIVR